MSVRVRFAPSPTGYLHIGGLRTALYCYLYARKENGEYLLRVEDTDQGRKVDDAVERLLQVMDDMGLENDEGPYLDEFGNIQQKGDFGPYVQSEKLDRYREVANKLVEEGHAYYCFCSKERLDMVREVQKKNGETPKYDGLCRNIDLEEAKKRIDAGEDYVVRLKLPEGLDISFKDHVRGEVSFNTNDLDDQVLIKQDEFPTYHLAVVVDDHDMNITHVMRGEEWLSSTPKHVYMFQALGWKVPEYVHLPLILNSSKKKLSKRQDDVAVEDFLTKGYLKEALINYVALVGWSPEDENEIMSLEEIISKFSLDRLSKSSAVFDTDKLRWLNSQYIMNSDVEYLYDLCREFFVKEDIFDNETYVDEKEHMLDIINSLKERVHTLKELAIRAKLYIVDEVELDDEAKAVMNDEGSSEALLGLIEVLNDEEAITRDNAKSLLKEVQKRKSIKGKALFMPIRAALSGELHGVDMGDLLYILGKQKVLDRLNAALN